ncbi:UNVERIFIED_CONTAM: hypothetical protein Scaly_1171600 [Sesamum calycinum]|uniref:Retrotransposon gag domain-containing protein n=1 Tax=Sesamum calycinum TaxID=2727403 RepID=A0AAW2Q351_9LAMI
MSKKLKESFQMSPLAEYVEKNLRSSSYASEGDAKYSPPSSTRFVSSYSLTMNVAPVMHVQEKDAQIARLINKVDNVDESHVMEKQVEAHDEVDVPMKQHYTEKDKSTKKFQISSDGLILVDQLKEFIEGIIKNKIEGSSRSSLTYSKHYTTRIDSLKMPMGNAFDWYTDLEAGSIDGWKQLEQEFINRSYSTRQTVSMVELTNLSERKEEPVVDYINGWRNLSHNCKDRLSEASTIEMCIKACRSPRYILQGILPKSFKELTTRAHDMELYITTSGFEGPLVHEPRRTNEKQQLKNGGKPYSEAPSKELMDVNKVSFKLKSTAKNSAAPKNNAPYKKPQKKLTSKEMQEKQYPFLNSDVSRIFDDLLDANLIELFEMKQTEEI